ncbi:hypothetical protein [Acetobacter pasteurianus]|uniref:Uncharacterized protein n=1 Tax=Acetobacter pasteurianus NBRC 3188 TaxID=1226663 RepID=A0A401WY73_ACEPA|nr:hypothetical protein [Acetobacter pasteurianus]GCD54271.1 hypothetical protein NBRC3188_2968 [Acetobacter pasteurianus NBRC 3188]
MALWRFYAIPALLFIGFACDLIDERCFAQSSSTPDHQSISENNGEQPRIHLPSQTTSSASISASAESGVILSRVSDNLRSCASNSNPSERLHCYDVVTSSAQITPSSTIKTGAWSLSPGEAGLAASGYTKSKSRQNPGLFVKCREGIIYAYVEFGERPFPVETETSNFKAILSEQRMDGDKTSRNNLWRASKAGTAIGVWDNNEAINFANSIRKDKTLSIKLIPDSNSPNMTDSTKQAITGIGSDNDPDNSHIVVNFYTEGADDALVPILAACKIKTRL